jgi:hypothetical protein
MADEENPRDDIAELAQLVATLADRLVAVAPNETETTAVIRRRAERLTSPERPVRMNAVEANSVAVTEPHGRVRLLMSGRATFPTSVQIAGKIIEHPRDTGGVLFFNEEGDECGGLVFSGETGYQVGSLNSTSTTATR